MSAISQKIAAHYDHRADFTYYQKHCQEIDRHLSEEPDIAIECCYTLIQGLCAIAYFRHDPDPTEKIWEKMSLGAQLKTAILLLDIFSDKHGEQFRAGMPKIAEVIGRNRGDKLENVPSDALLHQGASNIAEMIGTTRNKRGILCHGRNLPRPHTSSEAEARFICHYTQGLALLLLDGIGRRAREVEASCEESLRYDDNVDFNEWLDQQGEGIGNAPYSYLIYTHDLDRYEMELEEFTGIE